MRSTSKTCLSITIVALALAGVTQSSAQAKEETIGQQPADTVLIPLNKLYKQAGLFEDLEALPRVKKAILASRSNVEITYIDYRDPNNGVIYSYRPTAITTSPLWHTWGPAGFNKEYVGFLGSIVSHPLKDQHACFVYVLNCRDSGRTIAITIPFYCDVKGGVGITPSITSFGVIRERVLFVVQNAGEANKAN